MEDELGNHIWPIGWHPIPMTLNGVDGRSPIANLVEWYFFRTVVQSSTRIQLTACSRGPSASAELFVNHRSGTAFPMSRLFFSSDLEV